MRVHRSAHARNFTVLPNGLLQDRRLSFTARGLLADLLSRPDGWREDGRHMADTSPQGHGAIRKALKELTGAGYYRVEKIRMPDGTIRTETHAYDTPQLTVLPGVTRPGSGEASTGRPGALLVKNHYQGPSLPAEQADQRSASGGEAADRPEGREEGHTIDQETPAVPGEKVREAVATLFRAIRPEPRLRLGEAEATELAPLVAEWRNAAAPPRTWPRSCCPAYPYLCTLRSACSAAACKHKLPPVQAPQQPSTPRYAECAKCHDPVPQPGICAAYAGLGGRTTQVGNGAAVAAAGAARVRAAVLAARSALCAGELVVAAAK
ncbi:hypothetical protein [Kitasatospora aureofaciens]|uniref:hypothetical protein n=1 Tax=Kitasatospora aureofaciens TaxID=1894 RepID=UPI0037CA66EA